MMTKEERNQLLRDRAAAMTPEERSRRFTSKAIKRRRKLIGQIRKGKVTLKPNPDGVIDYATPVSKIAPPANMVFGVDLNNYANISAHVPEHVAKIHQLETDLAVAKKLNETYLAVIQRLI